MQTIQFYMQLNIYSYVAKKWAVSHWSHQPSERVLFRISSHSMDSQDGGQSIGLGEYESSKDRAGVYFEDNEYDSDDHIFR